MKVSVNSYQVQNKSYVHSFKPYFCIPFMQLLQWVHHKFRHGSIEPLKYLSIGDPGIFLSDQPSVDDQRSYMKSSFGSSYGSTSLEPPKRGQEKSFSESEANREEETSAIISELFHGFLTIGTLGSEPSINEPETPTFATTLENLSEQKTEVTQNDLKLISYELEKFLEAETKEEGVRASSARNSQASTITLNGKQMEESEDEEYWTTTVVCPLKEYLFGSSIELPDTRIEAKKEKTSLQELFDRTKMTTENCKETSESVDIKSEHKHTSAVQFMKKIIKKLHASSKSSAPCTGGDVTDPVSTRKKFGEASDSVSTKKKPHKILRMFHRRIHPESSTAAREFVEAEKYKDKNNSSAHGGRSENMMLMGRDNRRFPQGAMIKEGTEHCKKYMNLPQYRLSGSNFRRKGEHWIKTDADYLVLEL
ncbi:protein LAZY 1 isoform X2 [Prunus yedoensis var. nudiflora]|uniref:Protein LAZY 1 isoform X2 n=1 Tax=Prunus yedoensis var. nudiflora TaxID=2094558 RepID=A0A314XT25_PRUYE|nr:protein LAZY 1 isoform X2 [Prunus yedoensis var. nudiflora]